jgi:D-amino acid aminotransferase
MSRFAYVNGRFVRHGEAAVHIEDRGYQLADGVYEVWAVFGGKLADAAGHFTRLWRSLDELRIAHPMSEKALTVVLREAIRRNKVVEGMVYLQVTRGVAPRDHAFPNPAVPPAVVITAKRVDRVAAEAKAAKGQSVITVPETRWGRCDIKSIGLLPNGLAKQAARERGAVEAWFVDELGLVTEGASSNAWIVDAEGRLRTPRHPGQHPARHHPLQPAGGDRRGRSAHRRTAVHGGGGQGRSGGLHHRRGHAGSADRQRRRDANRRWKARTGGDAASASLYRARQGRGDLDR